MEKTKADFDLPLTEQISGPSIKVMGNEFERKDSGPNVSIKLKDWQSQHQQNLCQFVIGQHIP